MSQTVDKVIRHLIAWTGGDPTQAHIPQGKHRLRVHTQRLGDLRVITVTPKRPRRLSPDLCALSLLCTRTESIQLRGVIARAPQTQTLWLVMDGAGALPLAATTQEVEKALQALHQRDVIVQGRCSAQGIEVRAAQEVLEGFQDG